MIRTDIDPMFGDYVYQSTMPLLRADERIRESEGVARYRVSEEEWPRVYRLITVVGDRINLEWRIVRKK